MVACASPVTIQVRQRTRSVTIFMRQCGGVLEQTPQEPLADDLLGYTQAQRGTKSRALRISRSALR
jgi:hypothetical protein